MTSYLEITHFIKTFLQGSLGLFHEQGTTNSRISTLLRGGNKKKIIKREIFIWMKASDKKEGKNFLFCMIEEEKASDVQIKWQIRKSDISDF